MNKMPIDLDEAVLGCKMGEILDQLPRRLSDGILHWAAQSPQAVALRFEGSSWTYQQLNEAVREAIQLLQAEGVRPGDRIMVVSENCMELVALLLAASEMDVWIAPVNGRLTEREIGLIREDCEPRLILYTVRVSDEVRQHANGQSVRTVKVGLLPELGISELFNVDPEPVFDSSADQVLALIYTTGTTGKPKGVMLSHRNLLYVAMVSGKLRGIQPGDRVYAVLPMSHVFGLSAVTAAVLYGGASVHLVSRFDARECIRALRDDSVTGFLGVPTMYALMLEVLTADRKPLSAPALRFLYAGGAPLDTDIKTRIEAAFGLPLHNGYGLTESGPTITQTRLYAPADNCCVGRPLPGLEIRLLDSNGVEVDAGAIGELHVRGPNIMKGYFRNPDLTAQAVTADGWLNTGDLVFVDDQGNLNIAGRTKELIIHSGFNVYPPEVEGVLNSHEEVIASAVLGETLNGNENVVAYVETVANSRLTEADLKTFARSKLAAYKVPYRIVFLVELPKAASGKIMKASLRELNS